MMSNKSTKIIFEQKYPDGNGNAVRSSVSYDSSPTQYDGLNGEVLISDCVDSVEFSVGDIDWLINCLERIKAEPKDSE